jgi:MFS family permease
MDSLPRCHLADIVPFGYGWVILIVALLQTGIATIGATFGLTVLVPVLQEALDLSRDTISLLYTIATVATGLLMYIVGKWIDRFGLRTAATVFTVGLSAGVLLLAIAFNAISVFLAFFLLRLLGQGALPLVADNLIAQWWVKKRGFATSFNSVARGLIGQGLLPLGLATMMMFMSWRIALLLLAATYALFFTPLFLLLVRHSPLHFCNTGEDGMKMKVTMPLNSLPISGVETKEEEQQQAIETISPLQLAFDVESAPMDSDIEIAEEYKEELQQEQELPWKLKDAMTYLGFWQLLIALTNISIFQQGMYFHLAEIVAESAASMPVPSAFAASIFLLVAAIVCTLVSVPLGRLSDRTTPFVVVASGLLAVGGAALCCLLAGWLSSVAVAPPAFSLVALFLSAALLGYAKAAQGIGQSGVAFLFGRMTLGKLSGSVRFVVITISALGPLLLTYPRTYFGSFVPILSLLIPCCWLTAAATCVVKKPVRRHPSGAEANGANGSAAAMAGMGVEESRGNSGKEVAEEMALLLATENEEEEHVKEALAFVGGVDTTLGGVFEGHGSDTGEKSDCEASECSTNP